MQKAAYKLNHIITERGLTLSVQKTELVALKGREPVRSKIVMDNKIIDKVSSFNYLGNLVSCEEEVDIDSKLNNYFKITGIINNTNRPQKSLKKTRMKLHSTLTLPALLYCSDNWTITARDTIRITAAEMKCVRTTAGYIWTDHKTNTETAKGLNTATGLDKIQNTEGIGCNMQTERLVTDC